MATGSFGNSPSDLAFLGRLTVVSTHQRFSTFGLLATVLVRTATPVPYPSYAERARRARLVPRFFAVARARWRRGRTARVPRAAGRRALAIPRRGRGAGLSLATILRMNRSAFDSASVQNR